VVFALTSGLSFVPRARFAAVFPGYDRLSLPRRRVSSCCPSRFCQLDFLSPKSCLFSDTFFQRQDLFESDLRLLTLTRRRSFTGITGPVPLSSCPFSVLNPWSLQALAGCRIAKVFIIAIFLLLRGQEDEASLLQSRAAPIALVLDVFFRARSLDIRFPSSGSW